jgi:Ca2+-binding EF-hand superfamily protein
MSLPSAIKRADKEELKTIFSRYSSVKQDGERFMTLKDFVCDFLQILDPENPNEETLRRLGAMADTTQDDLISFVEFRSFESLLCSPDVINQLAFKLFDLENVGRVSFGNITLFIICPTHPSIHPSIFPQIISRKF